MEKLFNAFLFITLAAILSFGSPVVDRAGGADSFFVSEGGESLLGPETDWASPDSFLTTGVPGKAPTGRGWKTAGSAPRSDLTPRLVAAGGKDDLGIITAPSDGALSPGDGRKVGIPYEEKKRIAIPAAFGAGQECHAAAYEAAIGDPRESYDPAAWLCFSCTKDTKARTCFEARSASYSHQFVHHLPIVPIFPHKEPREGILFSATFSGGGSGWSEFLTLWVYHKECGQFINILPEIEISNLGVFKFLNGRKGRPGGVLVVAEGIWAEGEMHFDAHKCLIKIYRYSRKEKKFKRLVGVEFLTQKKYDFDGSPTTEVIDDQMDKIRQILARSCGNREMA
ncbi:MAG: hypothetical protein HY914_10715 [Desulfomonile tiedjei]|nr:hypothetical protein [Desulfomonile tiedjei]